MFAKSNHIEDAEFSEIKEPKNNLPIQFGSFPVALEKERLERVKHDIELNEKLGLRGQNHKLRSEVKAENIDLVMDKTKYPEINKKGLINLFGVSGLNWEILKHNLKNIFKFGIAIPLLCVLVLSGVIVYANWLPNPDVICKSFHGLISIVISIFAVISIILSVILGLGSAVVFCVSFASFIFNGNQMPPYFDNNKLIRLALTIEDLTETMTKIPYGAKLMLSEAMDSKLFRRFYLVKPDITELYKKMTIPTLDPAIVGVVEVDSEEKRFLITYWDIEKDKERVIGDLNNITKIKKLKV